jgi:hypothetical protein
MALFKDYDLMYKGIDTGILINGKTIDNYRPEDVASLIKSLPPFMKELAQQKIKDAIMGGVNGEEPDYEFDESRRAFHFQPDFTELQTSLKKKKTLYLYVYAKKNGELKMTDNERSIYRHKDKVVNHMVDCPACKKKGIIGTEYCPICWGALYISVKSLVKVIKCDRKTYLELKSSNVQGFKTEAEERHGYPEWTPIKNIRNGTALTWDDLEDMC